MKARLRAGRERRVPARGGTLQTTVQPAAFTQTAFVSKETSTQEGQRRKRPPAGSKDTSSDSFDCNWGKKQVDWEVKFV